MPAFNSLKNDVVVTVQTQGGGREGEKDTQELQNDVVTVQTQGGGKGSEKETQELQMRLQDQYHFPQASSQLKERESGKISIEVEAGNVAALRDEMQTLRNGWDAILSEASMVAKEMEVPPHFKKELCRERRRKRFHDENAEGTGGGRKVMTPPVSKNPELSPPIAQHLSLAPPPITCACNR
ncbi:hypothetical protein JOQ06_016061 [Pogonophryne albipinna]|uniref:Uncharacterized protein n=1 Tax=Pogonophryne albipinna TaxID=1090488 RepID=A0AAD6AP17_9TELE|nr:hypothetical protein JOQ06_016061 [Pogonophryne albipinna]